MFLSETLVFATSLAVNGMELFLLVYFVITLSDLECDYLNAMECCARLNVWVNPKLGVHAFLTAILMLHGHWWLALGSLPLLIWLIVEARYPPGDMGVYDPTRIHERDSLSNHLRRVMFCLAYYLLFFFVYLYGIIVSMLKGDPLQRHHDDKIVTEL